jgi:hypothetical protein
MTEEGRDDTTGRFVAGNPQSGRAGRRRAEKLTPAERKTIAAKGYRSATVAAGKIRDLLADLWARREWQETEYGFTVRVDEELAARIEEVLVRSKRTIDRTPGKDVEAS